MPVLSSVQMPFPLRRLFLKYASGMKLFAQNQFWGRSNKDSQEKSFEESCQSGQVETILWDGAWGLGELRGIRAFLGLWGSFQLSQFGSQGSREGAAGIKEVKTVRLPSSPTCWHLTPPQAPGSFSVPWLIPDFGKNRFYCFCACSGCFSRGSTFPKSSVPHSELDPLP